MKEILGLFVLRQFTCLLILLEGTPPGEGDRRKSLVSYKKIRLSTNRAPVFKLTVEEFKERCEIDEPLKIIIECFNRMTYQYIIYCYH